MPDRNTLRRAIAAAQTGAEMAEAVAALDAHDQGVRTTAAQSRELDLAGQHVTRALTPVPLFEHHTAATDWLASEDEPAGDYKTAMISEASVWYQNLDPAVRADREEFGAQLAGRVQTVASAWGSYAPAARHEFLSVVGYLHRNAASGLPQIDQTVDPNNQPSATPYPTEVFDNFAPPENDFNGGIEGEGHDSQISSRTAPMIQAIEQQNGGGSGFGSGPEKPVTHDTAFDPGLGYAEVPLGQPGTIPEQRTAAWNEDDDADYPSKGYDTFHGSPPGQQEDEEDRRAAWEDMRRTPHKQASYTQADPHGYRWVTGSLEIIHPFHASCGAGHWPGERCGGLEHTASVAIGYTGSLDDFRRTAQLELTGADAGRKAVAAAQGPKQLAEHYNRVMAGFEAQAASDDDTAVLHGFMAVVRPVLAGGSRSCLDFKAEAAGISPEAASSLPTEHQIIDPNNAPTPDADQFSTDVMFPIDPAFAEQWETGPQGAQPKSGQAKEAASMTPPPGAARMFGRMDAMEGKGPHHKDRYPFSKIQHGHYLRGWNESAGLTHGMRGRPPLSAGEYAQMTGRPDLHQHYLSHYALGSSLDNGPDTHGAAGESVTSALDAGLRSLAGDSGEGHGAEFTAHCEDCGHTAEKCGCTHDCTYPKPNRKQADILSMPHQTTDDVNPPFNSAETTPDTPGGDADAGYKAGVSDAQAGERPAFADASSSVSPYVTRYAEGYSSVHLPPPGQPDVPASMGGDSGQALNAQEAQQAFQVAKASKTAGTSVDLVTDGPGTSPDPMGSTPINGPGTPPPSGGRGDPGRSGGAPPYQGAAPLPGGPVVSDDVMGKSQEPEQPDGPLPMGFSGPGSGYGNQNLAPRAENAADGPGYENQGAYDGDPQRYKAAAFRSTVQANLASAREGK